MLALTLIVPQAYAAQGDWMLGLHAGTGIPLGDFKDAAKVGFLGGVDVGYFATENVVIGIDGSFVSNGGSDLLNDALTASATAIEGTPTTVTGKFTMIQGGAHLKYMFPTAAESSMSPYVVAGLGLYNNKFKTESSNASYVGDVSDTKFGARGGLGVSYKAGENMGVGVEGSFNWINTEGSSTQYVALQAALTFNMSNPK
jgi:opacity protein-like surface antigen